MNKYVITLKMLNLPDIANNAHWENIHSVTVRSDLEHEKMTEKMNKELMNSYKEDISVSTLILPTIGTVLNKDCFPGLRIEVSVL